MEIWKINTLLVEKTDHKGLNYRDKFSFLAIYREISVRCLHSSKQLKDSEQGN